LAGSCECGDEPSGSAATELVRTLCRVLINESLSCLWWSVYSIRIICILFSKCVSYSTDALLQDFARVSLKLNLHLHFFSVLFVYSYVCVTYEF
jgi:hypothetical protein